MASVVEVNNRPNLILKSFADLNSQRIVLIALPFLAFNPTTALVSAIGVGCYQGYTLWNTTADKTTTGNKWTQAALLVSSTALSYFCPVAQLVLSNGVSFGSSSYRLWKANNWQKWGKILFQMTSQSVHMASMYYGTPAWMGVSLLSQAGSEFYQAWKASKKDQTPEMIAFLILAALRIRKAATYLPKDFLWPKDQKLTLSQPTLQKLTEDQNVNQVEEKSIQLKEEGSSQIEISHSNPPETQQAMEKTPPATTVSEPVPKPASQPLRKATADDLTNLIKKYDNHFNSGSGATLEKTALLDVRAALLKEGFLPEIESLEFHSEICNCAFKGLSFKKCDFKKAGFVNCKFEDVSFFRCSFIKSVISNTIIKDSSFRFCDFTCAYIYKSAIKNIDFARVDLTRSIWTLSNLEHLKIQKGELSEACFLQSSVIESWLIDCNLKDALLLDAKEGFSIQGGIPHEITKPIVAIGWNSDKRGDFEKMTTKVLRENNMLVLPYNNSSGYHVSDEQLLFSEMQTRYKEMAQKDRSISQLLLKNTIQDSQVEKLKKDAAEILKYADGYIIPGGEDIESCLYNLTESPQFSFRSLLEIALLSEANQKKIPTMGICRGAQMINVFFGGTLLDVTGQDEEECRKLEWTSSTIGDPLRQKLGEHFTALSAHHQAVDQLGKGLQAVLKWENIPKMLLSEDGTFIASQIHPELYIGLKKEFKKLNLSDDKLIELMQHISDANQLATLNAMFANRNIFLFFFDKVQSFRASSKSSQY
jgi:gamma-glutamyl-gamma-aminobutyrate hydrolase PuuD